MPKLASKIPEIQSALDTFSRQHGVPGASLGIMSGDEVVELVTGVANVETRLPVTNDTMFQIGSNTKVFTAMLVMQLVEDGEVDLDEPVRSYLPEFKLADAKAADRVTVRQLVTHTSGIDAADYFPDFGLGDDSLVRFVESLSTIGMIHPPGDMWSYNNTGFSLAGRIVEQVTGLPFRHAFHDKILTPLGMTNTTVRVEDMLRRRSAVGHISVPGRDPIVTPTPLLPVTGTPAGSLTASTPRDMFTFVRTHLDGGRGPNGQRVLSEESTKAMQQPQAKLPRGTLGDAMGLGWILATWDGERVLRHGGGTVGQTSSLYVLPDRRFAVVLLTNSSAGTPYVWRDLGPYLFEELVGLKMKELPKPAEDPPKLDLKRYVGLYERCHMRTEFRLRNGELVGTTQYTGPLAGEGEPEEFGVRPIEEELFQTMSNGAAGIAEFMDFDRSGRPRYVHMGGRVNRRTADGPPRKPRPRAGKSAR